MSCRARPFSVTTRSAHMPGGTAALVSENLKPSGFGGIEPALRPIQIEAEAVAVRERCHFDGDRTAAAIASLSLLANISEYSGAFEPTLRTLRDCFERLIFSELPHPDVPLDQRVTYSELCRRAHREDGLAQTFLRRAEGAEAEVKRLRAKVMELSGLQGGLTAEEREQVELAHQQAMEEAVASNRQLLIQAQEEADLRAARAGQLRERLEAANQQAKNAYEEMDRRVAATAEADAAAVRRAVEPTSLTAASIAGWLARELSVLEKDRAELLRGEGWGESRNVDEKARSRLAAEVTREMRLLAG